MSQKDWLPGAVFSSKNKTGDFSIVKILAIDASGVHIRTYKEHFLSRPSDICTASLTLGSIHDKDGFGMGHLPLLRNVFATWDISFICMETVYEEELEGYKYWLEVEGGYFGPTDSLD
jgi:hypothetical protein